MRHFPLSSIAILMACAALAQTPPAQTQQPPQVNGVGLPRPGPQPPLQLTPAQPQPAQAQPTQQPAQQQPGQPQAVQPQGVPPGAGMRLSTTDPFSMDNVSLLELVDVLAKRLKINYILDKRVTGSVTIHTYGQMPDIELLPLLQTILRVNGATMVQVGNLWHIVPINTVSNLPTSPVVDVDPKTLPDDERMVLNLIFLKYTMADEMDKLLEPFYGEGARHSVYAPANLLILEDNSRSMRRTMELIAMFDNDTFVGQRVRLFEVENSRPTDLVKQLETVFKAFAFSDKNSAVHFIGIDPINSILAVAPNPGVFTQVKEWIDKLDIPAKPSAGGTQVWTYRMQYGRAEVVAAAIMALFSGNPSALMQMAAQMNSGMMAAGMGMNGGMMGGGGGGYGGGFGGGYGGGYGGGFGGGYGGYGAGYGGAGAGYGGAYGGYNSYAQPQAAAPAGITGSTAQAGAGQTGQYLQGGMGQLPPNAPHVIPNPFDNTVLVQGTAQDIEQIKQLVHSLDVAPRQVLIDAKIYEVDLDNELSDGVEMYLQKNGSTNATGVSGTTSTAPSGLNTITGLTPSTALAAATGSGGVALTVGGLINKTEQMIGVLNVAESRGKSRVISSPSIIATDSIPASMNVGTQVPTLSSQAVIPGVQTSGSSVFANTVSNESSGVTLQILAHVNSSGIVTMIIDQQVSAPIAPAASAAIQSPSFTNRSVSTQVTVHDGETIAIGGAILEQRTDSTAGLPVLSRIPVIGPLFGAKSTTFARTELIIFLTPRVIYDTTQITDATEAIKANLKGLQKLLKDQ